MSNSKQEAVDPPRRSHTGNFFAVDRRSWAAVCRLGINPAVAYLVLACGTQRNNRDTSWSVQAVYEYGGISPIRGKAAVQELCSGGYIINTKGGTRPQYQLLTWEEVLQARLCRLEADSSLRLESRVYNEIRHGKQPSTKAERAARDRLQQLGLLDSSGRSLLENPQGSADFSQEYIWLPKSLVMGTNKGEDPPIARIRRTRDVLTLRLLIDLYHAQHLRDDGGISRSVVRWDYKREPAGEQGIYNVWAFRREGGTAYRTYVTQPHWGGKQLWPRFETLQREGLVSFVPHLCEAEDSDSEVIHPYGSDWTGKGLQELENVVGLSAHEAGLAMADPESRAVAMLDGGQVLFAPVLRTYSNVQMVGIARLHYRPHTRITSQWWMQLQKGLPLHVKKYEELKAKAEQSCAWVTA